MYYEPDTVWGRTIEGDTEMVTPRGGLSLQMRRVLTVLAHPCPFATLAAKHHFEPPRLESDLIRLAQLQLVAYQRPGMPKPRTAPQIDLVSPDAVVAPQKMQRAPLPACLAATALGIWAVLLWVT